MQIKQEPNVFYPFLKIDDFKWDSEWPVSLSPAAQLNHFCPEPNTVFPSLIPNQAAIFLKLLLFSTEHFTKLQQIDEQKRKHARWK